MSRETIYDHPLYYDILFGWDRDAEADFYAGVFAASGVSPGARVLEVACGTGQIARRLARRGYVLTGLDSSKDMLAFLDGRARLDGVRISTLQEDMAGFRPSERFAAAFCPMSSFRLLHAPEDAVSHLRCVRDALAPGGVYVLDLEFGEASGEESATTDEDWEIERDGVTVRATDAGLTVEDAGRRLDLDWGAEMHLLAYTVADFEERVASAGGFRIASWHTEGPPSADGVTTFGIEPGPRPTRGRTAVTLARD